jgi:hypothetical protein
MAEDITVKEKGTKILRNAGNDRTSDTAAAPEHRHPQQTAVETSNLTELIKFTILAKLHL